jgi:hypothetical protein
MCSWSSLCVESLGLALIQICFKIQKLDVKCTVSGIFGVHNIPAVDLTPRNSIFYVHVQLVVCGVIGPCMVDILNKVWHSTAEILHIISWNGDAMHEKYSNP